MNKPKSRWGCLISGTLILILLVLGGGWWYLRSQAVPIDTTPASPVLVFILSPPAGDEINAGDFVTVDVQAVAPEPIQSTELFVDGQSLGMVTDSPQNASWTWQAFPVGVHTLLARSTASNGEVGESQAVLVNVLPEDGVMQVPAGEGQTLAQIGAGFGVPPDQMTGANPHVDPSLPLPGGQPVQVPVNEANAPGGGAGNGSGEGGAGFPSGPVILISWKFKPTETVDKSYCYTSSGDGIWEKMPKDPFEFLGGGEANYLQPDFPFSQNEIVIQAQCWGWLGGVLKYLGQGETQFDTQQPPNEVMIDASGFVLVGIPKVPIPEEKFTGGGIKTIPPPFALREPINAADCASHGHPLLAPFICDTLMNAPVKEYLILEWEWEPKPCWGGDCVWINEIDGYRLYDIDPFTKVAKYLKQVSNPSQKVTAIPLGWGPHCYGVQAYVNDPAIESSEMTTYCPGESPTPQMISLNPSDWLTTGGQWIQDGDCDTYGGADSYLLANKNTGFGNQSGQVLVGGYIVDDDDEDCFRQGDYAGAVKFTSPVLPPSAVIQQALLKYSAAFKEYGASGLATNYKLACVSGIGKAKQDWTGLNQGDHFVGNNVLMSATYFSPFASISGWDDSPEVDVTSIMKSWIAHPEQHHGFILAPASAPSPLTDGSGICETGVANFHLEIYYFTP